MAAPGDTISNLMKQDRFLRSVISPGLIQPKLNKGEAKKGKFSDLVNNPGLRGILNG